MERVLNYQSPPAFCGRRGDRGVCVMGFDHTGECETVGAQALFLTEEERGWQRFKRIVDDLAFMVIWTSQKATQDDKSR